MTDTEGQQAAAKAVKAVDRSRILTVQTLEKIDELDLRSTPEFYELWYRYFDGDPGVVRAIKAHQGAFDEITCQALYNKHLSTDARDMAVDKASDQVQKSIATLGTILQSANVATAEYGHSLDGVAEEVKKATTIEALASVISGILVETKSMATKNNELEGKLAESAKQVTELKEYLENVKKEATTDGLTGISNRKAFDRQISDDIQEAAAGHTPLVLMMLDIDHFKKFNDTYGHTTGDQVLRLVAKTLLGNVKGKDTAARYGGEEFAILLPGTPLKAGIQVAENLRKSVESKEITDKVNNQKLGSITLSIGIAKYKEGEDISAFIDRADSALYEAKRGGRNRVRVAVENKGSPREME